MEHVLTSYRPSIEGLECVFVREGFNVGDGARARWGPGAVVGYSGKKGMEGLPPGLLSPSEWQLVGYVSANRSGPSFPVYRRRP